MLQSYQSAIETLLNEDFHPGVSAKELETFKTQFRTSAYTCRLQFCPRATIGFETDLLRYEHEMIHAGGFRCTYSDCQFPPFPSPKALKAHVSHCHNIVPERKSIRNIGTLGAPRIPSSWKLQATKSPDEQDSRGLQDGIVIGAISIDLNGEHESSEVVVADSASNLMRIEIEKQLQWIRYAEHFNLDTPIHDTSELIRLGLEAGIAANDPLIQFLQQQRRSKESQNQLEGSPEAVYMNINDIHQEVWGQLNTAGFADNDE